MIGLRISAFSSDFKVTKIYNQMAYETLAKASQNSWQQDEKQSEESAWPHAVVRGYTVLLSVFFFQMPCIRTVRMFVLADRRLLRTAYGNRIW